MLPEYYIAYPIFIGMYFVIIKDYMNIFTKLSAL